MSEQVVSVLDGSTFVVSDRRGDVEPGHNRPHGFFSEDTRFISGWRLLVDGAPPDVLSVADREYFTAQFFLAHAGGTVYAHPDLSVIRRRLVRRVWLEELRVVNHRDATVTVELALELEADFADLFEVKDEEIPPRHVEATCSDRSLVLTYRREGFLRETRIEASRAGDVSARGFRYRLELAPDAEWTLLLEVLPHSEQPGVEERPRSRRRPFDAARAEMQEHLARWTAGAPELDSDWDPLRHLYRQSIVDLAALRFYPDAHEDACLPAAGLPWFMTLFGRDSLITSYQTLPFVPAFAATTLEVLAARQGTRDDAFRDQEPGKILHEIRFGELTAFGERPHSPYFGAADTTPLWLVLLDEYERWTGDTALVVRLEPHARAALEWIDAWGDRDGDGYVEYERRNPATGLENQCWKDSWNSMLFSDGHRATPPIAPCEVQGYVYDAKVRAARLARKVWDDPALADRLTKSAAVLQKRFDRDFWLEERGSYALALDAEKRPVDALTSNPGHALWSGIVPPDRAARLGETLMGPGLWSGWGVRTMGDRETGYNPLEYHDGTVWPHDSSLVAAGLARYGARAEAARIARATWEAAGRFANRLPEVFAGYERAETGVPVEYPTACRPQAWATAAPLLLLRTVMGLEPGAEGPTLDPVLPDGVGRISLRGVHGHWGRRDVEAGGA